MSSDSIYDIPLHPYCTIFPDLDDAEFADLVESIKKNGLRMPVLTFRGQVIDGKNRYRACKVAGIAVKTEEWDGAEDGLLDFVWDANFRRRQLTASQKAAIAAEYAEQLKVIGKRRMSEAGRIGSAITNGVQGRGLAKLPNLDAKDDRHYAQGDECNRGLAKLPNLDADHNSRRQAAEKVGVSDRYVSDALKIKAMSPEVFDELKHGTKSMAEAKRELGIAKPKEPTEPKHITEAKKKGIIPENVVVKVEMINGDDGDTIDDVIQEREERESIREDISDAEWLEGLPLSSILSDRPLRIFQEDALLYRSIEKQRKSLRLAVATELNKRRYKGRYARHVRNFLATKPPDEWKACPPMSHDGCGGSGQTEYGQCGKCFGDGYIIY